jgi:hypothetical protein
MRADLETSAPELSRHDSLFVRHFSGLSPSAKLWLANNAKVILAEERLIDIVTHPSCLLE